jgi:DNA-binding LytR/AlgR family response regulator
MDPLRVVIADDEPLALDRLSDLLGRMEGVDVVGAFEDAREVIESIHRLRPDLLLVDVEMPKFDGFDIVESLANSAVAEHAVPLVCFVTAYPQFASAAFDTGILDFLCKPVRLPRLERTVERAREAIDRREAVVRLKLMSRLLDELRQVRAAQNDERFIWVQQRDEMVRLDVMEIDWIEAESEYVRLHIGEKSYLLRSTITAISEELGSAGFIRIHRSVAVNQRRVTAVRRTRTGARLVLKSGAELPVGRKFRSAIAALLPN